MTVCALIYSEYTSKLDVVQQTAKAQKKGRWSGSTEHVRDIV